MGGCTGGSAKADNTVRLCGDYKITINPYLATEGYPVLNLQDLFATLSGQKVYKIRPQTGISAAGSESPDSRK